jgi:ABC-type lipoprotein export system ATPase subunit
MMEESSTLLELSQVTKEYDALPTPTKVLKGVDLRIEQGEAVAVLGPSGCGKSTLLNIMGALDHPTSGSVIFKGRDLLQLGPIDAAQFRNREIGFVFQLHHLLPQCTVFENVVVPTLVNPEPQEAGERARRLLERVGLADRADYRPGQLSGGERQRVAVVRALINRPSLLLADEPTGSLNREGADSLTSLLLELNREEGMTLVVVTHSLHVAERMERVLELRDGVLLPSQ